MLLYYSKSKIDNLSQEAQMRESKVKTFLRLGLQSLSIKGTKGTKGTLSVEAKLERNYDPAVNEFKNVLKTLKNKKKVKDLEVNIPIHRGLYIVSTGNMKFLRVENGYTASSLKPDTLNAFRCSHTQFFEDDMVYFEISISHNQFDRIIVACTAKNIVAFERYQVDPLHFERLGPNFYYLRKDNIQTTVMACRETSVSVYKDYWDMDVDFIVCVDKVSYADRTVYGSPLVLYC